MQGVVPAFLTLPQCALAEIQCRIALAEIQCRGLRGQAEGREEAGRRCFRARQAEDVPRGSQVGSRS